MDILEIPVIGSRKSEKEILFSLLSDQRLRKFEGLDAGILHLTKDLEIYFYFLNQEDDNYTYLWDLIIPYAIGCIVICDPSNPEIFEKNVEVIESLEKQYNTPIYLCDIADDKEDSHVLAEKDQPTDTDREFLHLNPQEKKSAKNILLKLIDSR
jgi:hypothetical protein